MNIYTLLIIVLCLALAVWRIKNGYRKGFVKEVSATVSIIIAVFAGYFIKRGITAFFEKRIGTVVSTVLIISIIIFIQKIVKFIFNTIKLFTGLPIIKGVDKLLGIVAGIMETVFILEILNYLLR